MKSSDFGRAAVRAISAAALLSLAACGESTSTEGSEVETGVPGTQNISALIAEADNLTAVDALVTGSGLSQTFDSLAAYTVFAPTDDAFAALGESFAGDEARPALVAILREHIVPGYLTSEDITSAIETRGGPVEMQTMGANILTFQMDGDTLTVSSGDGSSVAAVTGEMLGANGVVFPIDAVLKDVGPED